MAINNTSARAILISSIGGGLELYDFTIYVFFAPIIAKLFFPLEQNLLSLINTFAVFAIGYLARPIGAFFFGHYGDRLGRKKGMLLAITLMVIATGGIGCLPGYASIGVAAPLILILLRFVQGIAISGDLPGALTFVSEYTSSNNRGLYCGLLFCAVNLGIVLASAVGAILTSLLSHAQLLSWGWRIGFILGIGIGVLGFYLRATVEETPSFKLLQEEKAIVRHPIYHLIKTHWRHTIIGIGLIWFFAVVITQVFLYMPTFLNTARHLPLNQALFLNVFSLFIFSLLIPVAGWISDKVGRRIVIIVIAILFIMLSYPLYTLLLSPNLIVIAMGLLFLAILSAGIIGTAPATLTELFPTHIRYSGVAVSYNIAHAIFAGLTPVMATFLLYKFSFGQAPSFNLILAASVGLLMAVLSRSQPATMALIQKEI